MVCVRACVVFVYLLPMLCVDCVLVVTELSHFKGTML